VLSQIEQKKVKADYCIVGEPSGGMDLTNGHKGCIWMEVITHGKPAHGSTPWRGVNAFDQMVKVVQEINAKIKPALFHKEDIELDAAAASKTGAITLGGKVVTGDSLNIVPPRCVMTVDRRLAPGEKVQQVLQDFSSILDSLKQQDARFNGKIKILSQYEPCITPVESPLVKILSESLHSITDREPEISIMAGGCDLRYFHRAGISTMIYGPGDLAMAHQADEYVEIKRFLIAARVYALTAMRLLGLRE